MLTKSTKSILRAIALILAVLMTASVCLVGCADKDAQNAAAEAKAAADAAKALAQEAKDVATAAVTEKTLNSLKEELTALITEAQGQATADIANAVTNLTKQCDDMSAAATLAAQQLAADLAKKVAAGDVYTKQEIETKLAALALGIDVEDAAELIENALVEAKDTTDAAVAKLEKALKAYTDDAVADAATEEDVAAAVEAAFGKTMAKEDIEALVKTVSDAALTKAEVEAAIKAAFDKTLTKEAVEKLIDAAAAKTYTQAEIDEKIAGVKVGLSEDDVKALIAANFTDTLGELDAEKINELIDAVKNSALTQEDVQKLIDETFAQTLKTEAIEALVAEAKAYTYSKEEIDAIKAELIKYVDAHILSETAIQAMINSALTGAFKDFDAVTTDMVLSVGVIYMDVIKVVNRSYKPADFVEMYEKYLSKYFTLDLDGEEFDGNIDQQDLGEYLNIYSLIPTLIKFIRLTSSDNLKDIVADFNEAAKVTSTDEAVKKLADMILAIGEEKELTAVPAKFVATDSDDNYGIHNYPVDGEIVYFIPTVGTKADASNTNLGNGTKAKKAYDVYSFTGKLYVPENPYAVGELIYVYDAKADTYQIMRVTVATEKAGATPTDFAEVVTAKVVTVDDWDRYKDLLAKVDEFVEYFGEDTTTSDIVVSVKKFSEPVTIARYVKNAFTAEADAAFVKQAIFPKWGYNYETQTNIDTDTEEKLGVYRLITALTNDYDVDLDLNEFGLWDDEDSDERQKQAKALIGVAYDENVYFIGSQENLTTEVIADEDTADARVASLGAYVNYYFYASSEAYDFAHRYLKNFVVDAAAKLTTVTDNKEIRMLEVDETSDKDPREAIKDYNALVAALQTAIDDYKLFNLGNADDIKGYVELLGHVKIQASKYDVGAAETDRKKTDYDIYYETVEGMVDMLCAQYRSMTNTDGILVYPVQIQEFLDAADDIIIKAYAKASKEAELENWNKLDEEGKSILREKIKACDGSDFQTKVNNYLKKYYYQDIYKDITEAYAEYVRWEYTIVSETELLFASYTELYVTYTSILDNASAKNFESPTDGKYTIREVLYGFTAAEGVTTKTSLQGIFNKIQESLTKEIASYTNNFKPAKGKFTEACDNVYKMIYGAIVDAAEAYLQTLNDVYNYTGAAETAAKADYDSLYTTLCDMFDAAEVNKMSFKAKAALIKKNLETATSTDKKYPMLSILGTDKIEQGKYSFLFAGFTNQYSITLETAKVDMLKKASDALFIGYQNLDYKDMANAYKGEEIGYLNGAVTKSNYVNDCRKDMKAIYQYYYNGLMNATLKFGELDFDAAVKAYGVASVTDMLKKDTGSVWNALKKDYVDACKSYLKSYVENRAGYEKAIADAKQLVKVLKGINEYKEGEYLYIENSMFDLAVKKLEKVIADAKYVVDQPFSVDGVAYDVDVTVMPGKVFVTDSDLTKPWAHLTTLTDLGAFNKDGTWSPNSYKDARLYTTWCIEVVETELAVYWTSEIFNPLYYTEQTQAEEDANAATIAFLVKMAADNLSITVDKAEAALKRIDNAD